MTRRGPASASGGSSSAGTSLGGSRFLFDSFDAAAARIEANERVAAERWAALDFRLAQIDAALERLEKRVWLGVYGVAGFLLAQGVEALMSAGLK